MDLIFYSHFPLQDVSEAISNMNSDISSLLLWSKSHCLTLNVSKCKCIILGYRRIFSRIVVDELPKVNIDGNELVYEHCVRVLGVQLDNTLSWSFQVKHVTRKVFAAMHQLKRLRRFLPTSVRITLVRALIHPIFDYCSIVYNDMSEELNLKLQRALNYSVRYIFNLRRYEHITPFFNDLHWLKLKPRRKYLLLSVVYNIIAQNKGPQYLKESFTLLSSIHSRATRSHHFYLQIPHHRTVMFNSSFIVTASRLWNALPVSIVSAPSVKCFRTRLRRLLLDEEVL
jgi:hypothetical protein